MALWFALIDDAAVNLVGTRALRFSKSLRTWVALSGMEGVGCKRVRNLVQQVPQLRSQ